MTEGPTTISVLLDENVDKQVLEYLRSEGHAGEHVVDALGPGVDDAEAIAPYAREHDAVIVTKDTDFLAMDSEEHAGVFSVESHQLSAYGISTAIFRVVDSAPGRDYLRDVVYLDSRL